MSAPSLQSIRRRVVGSNVWLSHAVNDAQATLARLSVQEIKPVVLASEEAVGRAMFAELETAARPSERDLTIVIYSAMLHESLAAAAELAGEGFQIEVIDLRTVKPLDTATVLASVARTGKLLAVGEAFPWGGVTSEVIARVTTEGFHLLDAAPARINAKDTPIPYHPNLWSEHRPNRKTIADKARKILAE